MSGKPIPVQKLQQAKDDAGNIAASFVPETLEQCTAPMPDDDGLTEDEKFLAISRLEVSGKTRTSEGKQYHQLEPIEETTPKMKLCYGWVCQSGFYPEDLSKANQDNLLVAADLGTKHKDMALFGVFDGHGKYGTECSTFAVEKFGKCMLAHKSLRANPELAFEDSLTKVNKDMHKQKKKRRSSTFFDDTLAGTTAINVLFSGDEVIVANVGDSRAIIATTGEDGRLVAQPLSIDQTPYRKDERNRCKAAGAVVMTMDQLEGYRSYNPDVDDFGDEEDDGGDPPRLWLPNKGCPGVAFTRSLGDEMAEAIGCVASPEIVRRKLSPSDKFLVIASDGVFEFLSSQTVAEMVAKFSDPYEAARALVAEAYKLWLHYEVRTDDITAIVIFLDHPNAGAATTTEARVTKIGGSFSNLETLLERNQESRPVRREMSRNKRAVIEASSLVDDDDDNDEQDNAQAGDAERPVKSPEEIDQIKAAISTNFLFSHLNPMQLNEVLSRFELVHVKAGDAVIKQGDLGDRFYVVGSGEYDTLLSQEDGSQKKVHTYKATENSVGNPSFGELALMYSKPRAASVVATTPGHLWALDRKTFRRVLVKRPNKELLASLRSVKVLESLGKAQLQRLADSVSEVKFGDGDVIIRQGEEGDTMYVVKEGAVRVTVNEEVKQQIQTLKREGTWKGSLNVSEQDTPEKPSADAASGQEVMRIESGGYFGERALLQSEARAANVISCGNTICFYISRKAFEEVLGPLSEIIHKNAKLREAKALAAFQMEENLKRQGLDSGFKLDQLRPRFLVSETETTKIRVVALEGDKSKPFTLKSFDRDSIETSKTESRAQRDRELLPLAAVKVSYDKDLTEMGRSDANDTGFVFPVLKTFIGEKNLHVCLGGVVSGCLNDFMSSPFSQDIARFVAASTLLMLDSLHSKGILCRAINPQMLMLDENGYVKLADLGTSKYLEDESLRTFTICGDPGYVSPEQVLNSGHAYPSDYWALGVFIYEMVTGELPFKSEGGSNIFEKISAFKPSQLEFPENVTLDTQELIKMLLQPSVESRQCDQSVLRNTAFFKDFNWDGITDKTMESPLKEAAKASIDEMISVPTPRKDVIDTGSYKGVVSPESWFSNF